MSTDLTPHASFCTQKGQQMRSTMLLILLEHADKKHELKLSLMTIKCIYERKFIICIFTFIVDLDDKSKKKHKEGNLDKSRKV